MAKFNGAGDYAKFLRNTVATDLPKSAAKALTALAQDGAREVQRQIKGLYNLPPVLVGKYRPGRSTVVFAQKADGIDRMFSAVMLPNKIGSKFLPDLNLKTTGGTRLPFGDYIAIPTKNVRRGSGGQVVRSQMPGAVLRRKNVFIRKFGTSRFIVKLDPVRKKLVALYLLVEDTKQRRTLEFDRIVTNAVRKNFRKRMVGELDRAWSKRR